MHTPTSRKAISTAPLLIQLNRHQVSARRGVIFSGASGTGKTTALTQLVRAHELATRKRHPHDRPRPPVVHVTAPPAVTPKMLAIESRGLFAGARGRQIAGRFVVIPAAPFSYATTGDEDACRGLVGTPEFMLRLHEHAPGTLSAMSDYLFHRTGGMIGSLPQLVRGAAVLAIEDGSAAITEELLEIVPVDFAAEQSERLTAPAEATGRRRRAAWCSARSPTPSRPTSTTPPAVSPLSRRRL
ncbi:hypothetical protein [Streptomyces chrestomyceticus]|uniref:hypothetical protein n=1 Tax=Streptomyces chrestomyceticus TaxID=68185 RepID=UPI0037A7082C